MVRFFVVPLALAGFAVAAAPAYGDQEKPKSDNEKTICKNTPRTNSRFVSRTCATKEQWEEMREQNKRAAHEMIDRPYICTGKGEDAC